MVRRLPPLKSLPAFEASARHLSFTLAAQELNVTQSAISQQVKALEEYLGVALFRRLNRGVVLTEEGQHYFPLVRNSLSEIADGTIELSPDHTDRSTGLEPESQTTDTPSPLSDKPSVTDQTVRFCTASDGVRIAYSTIGHGPPIVRAGNWVTHLELDWGIATRRELVETLAQNRTVVRYDQRGNGLSDWDVDDISFDAFIDDLEAVIDDLGLDRFALFGQSQGAAVAAVYAARHPEKVSHLVMLGGFARGRRKRGLTSQTAESDALITLIREGWGKDNPAYVQMFGSLFMPGANSDQLAVFTDLQKASTTPDNAARIRFAIDDIDVSDEMENVKAPTLVVHAREDAMAPVEEGRRIAAAISGAVFVQLESRNHILLPNEPAWQRFLQKFQSFLST
jgi:pimeloyl-ACP methyl ester carboxylesterase